MAVAATDTHRPARPEHHTALVWLRRDLRLADNPALAHACTRAARIIPIYIHEPQIPRGRWPAGAASHWWLHHSLADLQEHIAALGGRLMIRCGPIDATLRGAIEDTGATLIAWNSDYEPAGRTAEAKIQAMLRRAGLEVLTFNGALLFEPGAVLTAIGAPYRVFTPFSRACMPQLSQLPPPLPPPRHLAAARGASLPLPALGLKPRIRWDSRLAATWTPGEAAAQTRLQTFLDEALGAYPHARNRPDRPGTSRLSPHLHFGELSARQVAWGVFERTRAGADQAAGESFLRQLLWREFAHHLLFHYPHTVAAPLDERFEHYPWRSDRRALRRWQQGRTGYPLVDAGMRELWQTGWMHNRVRMCVASFLTKNLGVHWLAGARWFWDTLVDADLANNTLGWQWVAGSGADAAPYFRVFNPVLQAEKFDPTRAYLRRWLPELAQLPDRWIHRPWQAPAAALERAGVTLGRTYPRPIVDLHESRAAALAGYRRMRQQRART